ncbi:hypothetical protein SNOG_11680 [Parastagonospora nodorum SN15]|uniref:AB hydrolase-1 domain-containing protein n=1 Tax=Phaeosphaeria nodorum (strain SN15 / ATCC MYA-4574 / FGSC 10173) TaxID=321614 RepID=Q0U984_PHANO|nr:hypothetical protein SNOG_11680 [Parastagonospora nodorum SN15]EAT80724.2 hypothetical protein SNOG_11680 [Parastagonospora nodorum SN15]
MDSDNVLVCTTTHIATSENDVVRTWGSRNPTYVILLGHSMGGLLAADIALVFRHRIVGVINFDVPFLGMHPGIIKAGLGSLFSPAPAPVDEIAEEPSEKKPSRMATFFNPQPNDPNFNPTFENDVRLPVLKSHFEFGSAMADYKELKDRYARVRALEEEDEKTRKSANPGVASPPRIRFVNYYTSVMNSPRISVEVQEHRDNEIVPVTPQEPLSATSPIRSFSIEGSTHRTDSTQSLAEIPPIPQEPPFVDLLQFTDKQERKAAEKEHDKALKEYQKAVKARNRAIKERTKAEEKWEKQQEQQRQKDREQEEYKNSHSYKEEQRLKQEAERMRKEHERMNGGPLEPHEDSSAPPATRQQEQKQKPKQESDSTEDSFPTTDMDTGYEMSPEEAPEIQTLDEDLGAMDLGEDHHQHQSSNHPYGNYDFSRSAILNQASPDDQSSMHESNYTLATTDSNASHPPTPGADGEPKEKKKKLGKFCMLPPKDSTGNVDPTWVRVFMQNMDEVTAHTSLFFVNETYERLVGDVGARIEEWIREADSVRVAKELEMQG